MNNDNDILTVREVAELLKVDTQTVRRYIKDGKLKAVKIAGSTVYRIFRKEVEFLFVKQEDIK